MWSLTLWSYSLGFFLICFFFFFITEADLTDRWLVNPISRHKNDAHFQPAVVCLGLIGKLVRKKPGVYLQPSVWEWRRKKGRFEVIEKELCIWETQTHFDSISGPKLSAAYHFLSAPLFTHTASGLFLACVSKVMMEGVELWNYEWHKKHFFFFWIKKTKHVCYNSLRVNI